MHEAILYQKLGDKKVKCTACRHYCTILDKNTGLCGVRYNKDGKLYLLVYGKASAVNTDPIEKKPLFHFLPGTEAFSIGTVGCSFGCEFCQNWELSQCTRVLRQKLLKEKRVEDTPAEVAKMVYGQDLPPEKIVETCVDNKIPTIAYTYNEPIIFFEYFYDTAKLANKKKIKNILVTSGYESNEALELFHPYIDAMNIDLKGFTEEFYTKICKAKLKPVLETIKKVHEYGIWTEITTLVIPGKNDSDKELKQIAEFIASIDKNIPWHISAFYPCYKMTGLPPTSPEKLFEAYDIGKKAGLNYVYVGNILDIEHSSTYCHNCGELLIKRDGYTTAIESLDLKKGICKNCNTKIPGVWK